MQIKITRNKKDRMRKLKKSAINQSISSTVYITMFIFNSLELQKSVDVVT